MDDVEDDARYPPNPRGGNPQSGFGSSANTQKLPGWNVPYSRTAGNQYGGDEDDEYDEDEDDEEIGDKADGKNRQNNGVRAGANDLDDEEDDDDDDDDDEDDDDNPDPQKNVGASVGDSERQKKKRKLKSIASSYEFAPRVPTPKVDPLAAVAKPSGTPKTSFGGRNGLTDWTETETFVLLDAWGDRFLQHGRKSLRSEEWHEVAEKVSEVSKIERTDAQCRNRLDTLKKKYKKEKLKLANEGGSGPSKWVYFRKMDTLMSSPPQKQSSIAAGLSCGVDSGEYVFTNPRFYLNRANGMDEMRDSPGNSEFSNRDEEEEEDSDGLPPKKRMSRRESNEGSSFKLLADSIMMFSDIYEKIENRKSQQMAEIERMRMEFQRDLEVQRRQIMERARAEIAKIVEFDEEEKDHDQSGENPSG